MKRLLFLLMAAILLTACGSKEEPATITQDEFKKLEKGMTVEEVSKIVGGEPKSTHDIEESLTVEYEYEGEDGVEESSSVTLYFKEQKLDTILESGLITKDEPVEEDQVSDEPDEEPKEDITTDEAKEIIEYAGLGEEDKLVNVTIEDGEIKAVIDLAPHELLPVRNLATTSYSQASDALLEREGWEILTIEYVDVGTISMDRREKETNEFGGDYFPTVVIDEKLK